VYINELTIETNAKIDNDIIDEFNCLLATFYKNGQTEKPTLECYVSTNFIKGYITTLEKNSLDKKYRSEWTNKQLKKVEKLCSSKLQIKIVGTSIINSLGSCKCIKQDFLILYTHLFDNSSSVICGTCFNPIPLYKLNLGQETLHQILGWQDNYKSCDTLQLQSVVGEKWATKQMTEHNSQLSKQGIEICSKIKSKTGISTYYYLFNYRRIKLEKDKERNCPSCYNSWLLDKPLNRLFDFKCDNCELVSSLTSNGY